MARHQVRFSIPEKELLRAGIEVEVWRSKGRNLRKFGRLRIRKGSLEWFIGKQAKAHKLTWEGLARFARKV